MLDTPGRHLLGSLFTSELWGCEEPRCRIHGTNESVSKDELTRMTTAETLLLHKLAAARRDTVD